MAGYTRQDTANNIANGNVIDADDFDAEYNAIESAFNASTGHSHDGTAGEGAPIEKVGPSQDLVVTATSVLPKTTNTLDLGSASVQFKDAYFDGTVDADAFTGPITGDITGNVTGNVTGDVTGDVTGNADTATALETARQIGGVLFDGTANINLPGVNIGGTMNTTGNAGTATQLATAREIGGVSFNGTTDINLPGVNTAGNQNTSGNAATATKLFTSRNFSVTGDVTATAVSFDGTGNVVLNTAMANNAVDLGTHTTGNYVASLVAGTGVSLANNTGETATPTISIGQSVGTTDNVTFNSVTVDGNLTVNGTTTTVDTETIKLADNVITVNSNYTGSTPTEDGGIEVERGTLANKSLVWDESADKWSVGSETFVAATFEGNLVGAVTGNADTASTLKTARTISLTGDVSGSVSFNGGSNVSISATVADDSHNHVISNVDGLQSALDAKAPLSGANFTGSVDVNATMTANKVALDNGANDWTFEVVSNKLVIKYAGVSKMELDTSGNLKVTGDVTAYGSI